MSALYRFQCTLCGATYAADEVKYVCRKHDDAGILDTILDFSATRPVIQSTYSVWRYLDLLPIAARKIRPLLNLASPFASVGWTPLYRAERLGAQLGLKNFYIKDDGRNPSASFKDRASAFVVAKAIERGEQTITTASSGNAGAALACLSAAVGLPSVIFVPHTAPQAKVAQLLMFGAKALLVKGTYDDAFDVCLKASKEFGWYCRNTAYNPFTIEGKKTVAFEICEQLSPDSAIQPNRELGKFWRAPDRIFVGVGDGNILSGVWKGLRDLQQLGWIQKMPKLMGVQAEGSAACYNAWRTNTTTITPVDAHTIADSISVGLPRDGARAVRAVQETGGEFVTVSDAEILQAMKTLSQQAAVFAEPAGAAGFAGLQKLVNEKRVDADETIVVIVTGNGLKDVPAALKAAGEAHVIEPTLDDVQHALEG